MDIFFSSKDLFCNTYLSGNANLMVVPFRNHFMNNTYAPLVYFKRWCVYWKKNKVEWQRPLSQCIKRWRVNNTHFKEYWKRTFFSFCLMWHWQSKNPKLMWRKDIYWIFLRVKFNLVFDKINAFLWSMFTENVNSRKI